MQPWYCVHTKPHAEAQALGHLQRQGFECLLPRVQSTTLRSGRWRIGIEALFPRYLFLRANAAGLIALPERRLLQGECVAIIDGPLAGLQGIYAQAQGKQRARVLLEILGGAQSVALPNYVLKPVGLAKVA